VQSLTMKKKRHNSEDKRKGKRHFFLEDLRNNWVLWVMLIPAAVFFVVNSYMPMAGIWFAFIDFNFRDGLFGSPFVGFKNFEFLTKSNVLMNLTVNTLLYNLAFIIIGHILQIFMAILISQLTSRWYKKTVQTMMLMPYFTSMVIVGVCVFNLFNYEYGVVNNVITVFGGESINFYGEKKWWPFFITAFYIWKNIGYGMIVYLATILSIDNGLYEAAKIDGANIFQQIRYIVLPHLKPTFIILIIYNLGSIMKGQFALFYQIIGNNGLLFEVTDIIDTYVYRATIDNGSFSLGAAAGLYQSIFGFVVVMLVNWLIKRKNPEYALF